MRVNEVMTRDPACCTPDTRLQEVARMMRDRECGEIPVIDDVEHRRLVGVVTDRDIAVRTLALGRNPMQLAARDCMSSPVVSTRHTAAIEECCHKMEEYRVRRLPVVDERGRCCGIVSHTDIARTMPTKVAQLMLSAAQAL